MENIPFLNKLNFEETISRTDFQDTGRLIPVIKDMIDYAPFASDITCKFILEALKINKNLKSIIKELLEEKADDADINISRCIYATYFGAKTNINEIRPISEYFNGLTVICEEFEGKECSVEHFCINTVIKMLSFNIKECLLRLKEYPFDQVIDVLIKKQNSFNESLVIYMCRFYGFLETLEKRIDEFPRKDVIIACIFINFFSDNDTYLKSNKHIDTEKNLLHRLITGSTLDYCLLVCNREKLGLLLERNFPEPKLPHILHSQFKEASFESKKDFFESFLKLTSPSISHFLSYLEFYKNEFKLTAPEQAEFKEILCDFHKENLRYSSIALQKLKEFKILQ
ncbi:hypothetical protein GINT2_001297 [Glugoides intestinalis]